MLWCCTNHLNKEVKVETDLHTLPSQKKIRPLLCDLEQQFKKHAGKDGVLDKKELMKIWKSCARQKFGKLTKSDAKVIEDSVEVFFAEIDQDSSETITYDEFVAHMLGANEERAPLKNLRQLFNASLKADPAKLSNLIEEFKKWDLNGDGLVEPQEIQAHLEYMRKVAMEHKEKHGHATPQEQSCAELERMVKDIFEHADVDGDGKVDLWEVMAYALGRKKAPVELLLYDISKGSAGKLGKALLGKKIEAVHSGVLVYDSEYWYGGRIFRSEPPCREAFGEPLERPWGVSLKRSEVRPDLPCIHLGYTFVTHDEFVRWLGDSGILDRYTGIEKYDLLTHSCNHFANEAITFLTGSGVPEKVFELQKTFLSPAFIKLRPFINNHLGGFADATRDVDEHFMSVDAHPDSAHAATVVDGILGKGEKVIVENMDGIDGMVPATILSEKDGMCEIKYFDVAKQHIVSMSNVPKAKCRKFTATSSDGL